MELINQGSDFKIYYNPKGDYFQLRADDVQPLNVENRHKAKELLSVVRNLKKNGISGRAIKERMKELSHNMEFQLMEYPQIDPDLILSQCKYFEKNKIWNYQ